MQKKNVIAVIGARLNSSRLPGKQLLDLAGRPLIEHVFRRLESIPEIDRVVLATTSDEYNEPLVRWAQENQRAVFAFEGDVNDLMGRVDVVAKQENADVLVYICGDSPLIEPSTISRLLSGMLSHDGVDTVNLSPLPDCGRYIHEGIAIYSRKYWDDIYAISKTADEREHVGFAKDQITRPILVLQDGQEPSIYSATQHRISVDTPSDYAFMQEVYTRWYQFNSKESLVSLAWAIEQLMADEDLRALNANVEQKQVGEVAPTVLLVTEAAHNTGLGHLRRTAVLARELQDLAKANVQILTVGEEQSPLWTEHLNILWIDSREKLVSLLYDRLDQAHALVADVKVDSDWSQRLQPVFHQSQTRGIVTVSVDGLLELHADLDFIWSPSHFVSKDIRNQVPREKLKYGWDAYVLPRSVHQHQPGDHAGRNKRVVVTVGGSDIDNLGATLPTQMDEQLPAETEVHWVQGPYAASPLIPSNTRLKWTVHQTPADLFEIYQACDVALSAYGVSLFELLNFEMPTVALMTSAGPDQTEWNAFKDAGVCACALNTDEAVGSITQLLKDEELANAYASKASRMIDGEGGKRFVGALLDQILERDKASFAPKKEAGGR